VTLTSGILTPRINQLVLGCLWDRPGIAQGYDQVLDIPGVSFEVSGISLGYPWDIPKQGKISQNHKTWNGISQN
jgi:hypothetical protein